MDELKKVGMRTLTMPNMAAIWVILGGQWPTKPTYDPKVPWAQPDAERARKVRLALNLAVDKKAIFEQVLGGMGTPVGTVNYYPTDPWISEALLKPLPYDPARAKTLLAEAGYPDGFEVTMNLTAWPGSGFLPDVGEAVATYWEKVGLKVKRRPVDRAVFSADFRERSYAGVALAYAGPIIAPEPWELFARIAQTKAAVDLLFEHPKLDAFIERLGAEPSAAERTRIMREEMGPWLYEYMPGVAIGATHSIAGVGPKVGEWPFIPGHMGFHNWEYVTREAANGGMWRYLRACAADAAEHAGRDQHRVRPDPALGQSRAFPARRQRDRAGPGDPDASPRARQAAARPVRHLREEHSPPAISASRCSPAGPSPSTSGSACPPPSSWASWRCS